MSGQNKTPTDIKQLKLNILNRSASFKKNRNEGAAVSNQEQKTPPKQDTGYYGARNDFYKTSYEENDSDDEFASDTRPLRNSEPPTGNLNMDIQARVLAFHEQRQHLKRTSSMKKRTVMNSDSEEGHSPLTPSIENQKMHGSRKASYPKNDSFIEVSFSEKRGSLGTSSPVTPSIEVVNKPLPPLPQAKASNSKTGTSNTSFPMNIVDKKMQKLDINANSKNTLNNPTRKIYDDESSSVSSLVTSDSEPDTDHNRVLKDYHSSHTANQQQKMHQNDFTPKKGISISSTEKFAANDSSELFNRPLSPKSYTSPRNNISSISNKENKPISPLRASFSTENGSIPAAISSQITGEMNPKRKPPAVPSNFQTSTQQTVQLMNLKRGNTATNEATEQPILSSRSQQKIKMGLSARRGLKLDMSKMKPHPSSSGAPTQQLKLPKASFNIPKASSDYNSTVSTDSISSCDSTNLKSTSGNWSNLTTGNRTSQIYGNTSGNTNGTDSISSMNNGVNSGGVGSIFANFSKYVNIKNGSLNFAGKLSLSSDGINFSNGSSFSITFDELEYICELGSGNYGNVSKVLHKPTQIIMAMKEVRLELDESKFRQILMELDVLHKCSSAYIVDFYGAFFVEGAVYMCMECMDGGSLDKLYSSKGACDAKGEPLGVPEPVLAKIAEAVISGLKVLKDDHNIIHRDVKPTNILCSAKEGTIKLCDFGVSGNLVASLAKTNIGCQSYMAPERIKSFNPDAATYSVHSDVWSLGLTLVEIALGKYPYPPETFGNIFSQLSAIVDGKPPSLPKERFSAEAQDFINCCLEKNPERRPNYGELLEHPWILKYRNEDVDLKGFFSERLETIRKYEQEHMQGQEYSTPSAENSFSNTSRGSDSNSIPALHRGGWTNM